MSINKLEIARAAWLQLSPMRKQRSRLKAFTYGRQWDDRCVTADGRSMTEQQRMREEGRTPITNNIIRQMVKSIVGRYRYLCTPRRDDSTAIQPDLTTGAVTETDARLLEEFLISGIAAQRVEHGEAKNVSPERLFFHPFSDPEGRDMRMAGMLHDMPLAEVINRFGGRDARRAAEIRRAYSGSGPYSTFPAPSELNFDLPSIPDTLRVIEMWQLTAREYLRVYDPFTGLTTTEPASALSRLEGLNRGRKECGTEELKWAYMVTESWEGYWLTPKGYLLHHEAGEACPLLLKLYPLIDGEIHSLVEDVVDQQKYVNRLISILDHIISASAKGVLLYPSDQLPEGFTWKDLRRIWANPTGILPFKRTGHGMMPQQVTTGSGSGAGATDMLKMQLSLFDEISGSTSALRGRSHSATGEGMLRAELENATISMLDLLAAFRNFIIKRDRMVAKTI